MASSNSSWKNLIPSSVDIKTAAETMSMIERAVFRDENSSSGSPVSANSRRLGKGIISVFFLLSSSCRSLFLKSLWHEQPLQRNVLAGSIRKRSSYAYGKNTFLKLDQCNVDRGHSALWQLEQYRCSHRDLQGSGPDDPSLFEPREFRGPDSYLFGLSKTRLRPLRHPRPLARPVPCLPWTSPRLLHRRSSESSLRLLSRILSLEPSRLTVLGCLFPRGLIPFHLQCQRPPKSALFHGLPSIVPLCRSVPIPHSLPVPWALFPKRPRRQSRLAALCPRASESALAASVPSRPRELLPRPLQGALVSRP